MADKLPPAERIKYISKHSPQITIIADCNRFNFEETFGVLTGKGPDQRRFTVHKSLFTKRSKLLEAATSSRWTSGINKPVDLTEHEPAVFDSYMQCVYLGSVTVPEVPKYAKNSRFGGLITLYLLADKLYDGVTTNIVMDEIIRTSDEARVIPCRVLVALVYKSTIAGSPLRRISKD